MLEGHALTSATVTTSSPPTAAPPLVTASDILDSTDSPRPLDLQSRKSERDKSELSSLAKMKVAFTRREAPACYLLGLVRCSLRYLAMPKALILSPPNTGSIRESGVNHCLFSGSWA